MNNTSSTTHGTCNNLLVSILLTLHFHRWVDCHGAEPIVAVILSCGRLGVNLDSRNVLQQLFIEFLHMFVMSNMLVDDGHLAATDTGTNVTHTVVETNLLMLVVGIALAILGGIHHNLAPLFFVVGNQGTATRSGNHLVAIETQHAIFSKCSQYLTFILRTETFSSILNDWNIVAVSNLHNAIHFIRHTIQSYGYNGFRFTACLGNSILDCFLQQVWIHVPSVTLAINENRSSTKISNRVRRSAERETLHTDLITCLHATGNQRKMHRSCTS